MPSMLTATAKAGFTMPAMKLTSVAAGILHKLGAVPSTHVVVPNPVM